MKEKPMKKEKCEICKRKYECYEMGTVLRRSADPAKYCTDCIEKRCLYCMDCERTYDAVYHSNRDCPRCGRRGVDL